jgi:hypothetical protein
MGGKEQIIVALTPTPKENQESCTTKGHVFRLPYELGQWVLSGAVPEVRQVCQMIGPKSLAPQLLRQKESLCMPWNAF